MHACGGPVSCQARPGTHSLWCRQPRGEIMPAPPLHPIVLWFGRVGDMILMSALLGILHRRYGGRCHVIGAGSWPAEIYASHPDVERVDCLRRYTAPLFDPNWWHVLGALRANTTAPVYVCEFDPRKL